MKALPAHWYRDPATLALERERIFDRGWHLLAHASRLRKPGDHVVADCAGLPVLAVRGTDADGAPGPIRAFHNVCRHRAGPLALCDGLAARSLRCRYHGWTYALDGVLRSAPEMGTAPDFKPSDIVLPQLAVRVWQGLVFAAVDETNAPGFEAFVAGIDARLGANRGLAQYGHHHRTGYDVACNWKVYVDNYLEGYHVPHIHPGLNSLLDYRQYVTECGDWFSYQYSPLESDPALYGDGDALYYFIYPNTMLNLLPGRLQSNRVLPLGPERCIVEFDYYYLDDDSDEAAARRQADHDFAHQVQDEDIEICEHVQRGLASGSYVPGRLNPLRENAVFHYHELLRAAYRAG